jgi:transcriptional regulator with XRE-family HTH domain
MSGKDATSPLPTLMEEQSVNDLEPVDDDFEEQQRHFDAVRERMVRQERRREQKARRERFQRDMGIGYLIYVARRYRRMSQGELARKMGTARSVITRWESAGRLPSLLTLERIAGVTDLEVVIGLRDPEDSNGALLALGAIFDEGAMTELLILIDKNHDQLRVTPWRKRMAEQYPRDADLLL